MNIAFCYESVLPERGGCETYIADLARRLVADRHQVHLYACRWDESALPEEMHFHKIPGFRGPRSARPWRFAAACLRVLEENRHDVSIGFDKTWGQDVLYPQGGLHSASADYNLRKYPSRLIATLARILKYFDLAHWSYRLLEAKQYLCSTPPLILVNSEMVRHHFQHYLKISATDLCVLRSAIDSERFVVPDRPRRRIEFRDQWGISVEDTVGLFVAMNYRLKGLEPLLHAVALMPSTARFRLLVAGSTRTTPYEQLARRLGIEDRVLFLGQRRDINNCYFAADFLVHPTFYDPCSLVVLEALACGLPVITSRYNGASELLQPPDEGFVVDNPHDHARLARCMEQLLDPARRLACAQAARRAAARWTFDHHYRQLVDIFREVAERKQVA